MDKTFFLQLTHLKISARKMFKQFGGQHRPKDVTFLSRTFLETRYHEIHH